MALVTFDLFSALIDSRRGGARALARMGRQRRWRVSAETVYDEWDARNKASQKSTPEWVSFAEHSRRALADTYRALDLCGDPMPTSPHCWPASRTGRCGRTSRARGRDCAPGTGWACCRTSTTKCLPAHGWRRW